MAQRMIESFGGRLEAFDFAFGPDDVVLLTLAEIDQAAAKTVGYQSPGK